MADLVKRLRAVLDLAPNQFAATATEAADAIEELTAALDRLVLWGEEHRRWAKQAGQRPEVSAVLVKRGRALLSKYGASNG